MMNLSAYQSGQLYTHYKLTKVVDGDGLIVSNIFTGNEIEIRLLGIDAPEIKKCKKLIQDERELHLPGELLIELGQISFRFLKNLQPINSPITFYTEGANTIDIYGRTLAYVFMEDGNCLNENLVKEGMAKPYNRYDCSQLLKYQDIFFKAKQKKLGIFKLVAQF